MMTETPLQEELLWQIYDHSELWKQNKICFTESKTKKVFLLNNTYVFSPGIYWAYFLQNLPFKWFIKW